MEGLVRHLRGRDKPELDTVGLVAVLVLLASGRCGARVGAALRRRRRGLRSCSRGAAVHDEASLALRAEAEPIVDELAGDLTGAEGHGDLVAGRAGRHWRAIVVNVHGVRRELPVVAPVNGASLTNAGLRGDDDVARARVKDHRELLLLRVAHGDGAEVDALVGDGVSVALHWHPLPVQGDDEAPRRWRPRAGDLLGKACQPPHGQRPQEGHRREGQHVGSGSLHGLWSGSPNLMEGPWRYIGGAVSSSWFSLA
mmetsp:Transcript_91768/g.205434  ORF Transcript_91768/g.205434 Transcript_91768/m.205434 type:complete len:254 (-) Transcript_91768:6-767(-)